MISNMEKIRLNKGMLVSRDRNCNGMMAGNTSKRAPHQCGVSTTIKR